MYVVNLTAIRRIIIAKNKYIRLDVSDPSNMNDNDADTAGG